MPIAFIEGFDRYSGITGSTGVGGTWVFASSMIGLALVEGRFENTAMLCTTDSDLSTMRRLFTPDDRVGVQFAIRPNNIIDMNDVVRLLRLQNSDGETLVSIATSADGQLLVRGPTNNVLYTSPALTLQTATWSYIELHVELSATVGKAVLKVNGEVLYTGVNLDLIAAITPTVIDRIVFSWANTAGPGGIRGSNRYRIDDLIVLTDESETLGELRIQTRLAIADVTAQFTRLSGTSNFAMIDETQVDSETTYNSSSTVGNVDRFDIQNLTTTPERIFGVFVSLCARKDDGGTRQLTSLFRIGGVDYDLSTQFMTNSYVFKEDSIELNPATGLAWTIADINALQIGYRLDQ